MSSKKWKKRVKALEDELEVVKKSFKEHAHAYESHVDQYDDLRNQVVRLEIDFEKRVDTLLTVLGVEEDGTEDVGTAESAQMAISRGVHPSGRGTIEARHLQPVDTGLMGRGLASVAGDEEQRWDDN